MKKKVLAAVLAAMMLGGAVTVTAATDIILDLKIHLIGDITGDGRVNTTDVARANAHAKKTTLLTDYEFECADVNNDGKINTRKPLFCGKFDS